jgi:hypothetical protein
VSFLTTVLQCQLRDHEEARLAYVALLGSTESTGTTGTEGSLSTSTATGWAVSGDVANTTTGLVVSFVAERRRMAYVARLVGRESTTVTTLSTSVTSTEATLLSITRLGAHSGLIISFLVNVQCAGQLTM